MKMTKFQIARKLIRLMFYRVIKRRWYLPNIHEITVDELYDQINSDQSPLIIDTREKNEYAGTEGTYRAYGHIPNAKSIPILQLAGALKDLEEYKEKEVVTYCPGGGMSLSAVEIMEAGGFTKVKSLKGGLWKWYEKGYPIIKGVEDDNILPNLKDEVELFSNTPITDEKRIIIDQTVDARDLACPGPILNSRRAIKNLKVGQVLEIITTDPGSKRDIPRWTKATGQELLLSEKRNQGELRFLVKKLN